MTKTRKGGMAGQIVVVVVFVFKGITFSKLHTLIVGI